MASPSSRDEGVQLNSFTAMASDQQTSSSKTRSNEPGQNRGKGSINRDQEKLLVRLCAIFPTLHSRHGALPTIPEIRVKGPDSRDARTDAGGSVSPSNHPQSTDYLQVPSSSKPRAQHKSQTVQPGTGRKRTFLGFVGCALGLQRVRTYGDHEPLVGRRYRAKRNTFRMIALFGILMMLNLAASIALFVYFASMGGAGPEWFAWIAISAAGWIWSFLAFIMAKQSKKRVLHDVEIARQSIRLGSRVRDGTAAPVAIIGGPSANKQQVMRAGSSAATSAAPVIFGKHPELELVHEEDWARDAEDRLNMLVAN
ncbi:uncharacterized protein LY79DRAFT_686741 [Colletotrichum navitas]|uniref:Uncharacterized protein n=1 Tax=Colletotrichum navitas TaxID=681940 RepID=A0AAD8PIU5_9PEZI|nr:uncharacterized protein LY79DRAFT_686741 [Colletotrichum navitas]KAK1561490.1 hypothetical protein LY79DRAFT_686741 [Colletotrichum navitas]